MRQRLNIIKIYGKGNNIMIRVGIDGHMIGDHSGGNESFYTNILLSMKVPPQIKIYLFLKKGIESARFENKFNIIYFEEESAFKRNFIELPKLCKKLRLDVLHTQYFIPFNRSCKVVCTIHDICFEHYRNIFTKKEYLRQKLLIPYAARKSEIIYTVSQHAKNDIISHYKVDPKKVIVTYNAVNADFRKLNESELAENDLRDTFGIGSSRYILSVGNLQPRKNLPRLIRAFTKYQKNNRDVKLVIVGKKAWMFDSILKEACENSDGIIFTDYVSNKDLVRLYNAADSFIYPSFFEGFGIPPLEAIACGKPVAVANVTSLPEVVGDAGIYFDPFSEEEIENAIQQLLSNDVLREKLKKNQEKQVQKFSWNDTSKKLVDSYLGLFEE